MMKIGSLFSGIGGLDIASELATGGELQWAIEQDEHCTKVLSRHWHDAQVIREDVQEVDPLSLDRVSILNAGFPCSDLSVAGGRAGLDGDKSGLYRECLRFAQALEPEWLIFENVHGVLKYRDRIDKDLADLGYGTAWVKIAAGDIGAPQWRKRVFIICRKGFAHAGIVSQYGAIPNGFWPTAVASGDRFARYKQGGVPLGRAVRLSRQDEDDEQLPLPGKLNPAWVEVLQGFPEGWTLPHGRTLLPHLRLQLSNGDFRWPAQRGDMQYGWEPSRLIEQRSIKGRPARLKALGNAVVPAQGMAAIELGIKALQGVG